MKKIIITGCNGQLGRAVNIELGMHVRFLEDWTLDVTLADIQLWRNCTNKFFGLPFEKTNEGKRILTVLTSHEYCMEKYKRKWKEFLDYYHEAKQTIDYIKEYLPTTWEKLAKKDKIKIARKARFLFH